MWTHTIQMEGENGNEFVPYKKLVNAIRKEMKARKLFKWRMDSINLDLYKDTRK